VLAAALGGCAGTTNTAATVTGSTLKVYAGQPPNGGQQAQDVLDAERLALAQAGGQVGRFKVVLKPLSGAKLSDNARTAISDSSTIAFLGDLAPHSSANSLGITNGVGILQVSPTDTAIDLTQTTKAVPGAPTRYYESLKTYGRTFGRVAPAANREAAAQAQVIGKLGVRKLYVTDDGGPYGKSIALALAGAAAAKGITVTQGSADAARVQSSGSDAVFFGGNDRAAATRLFDAVDAASPNVKLFGPSTLDDDAFAAGLTPAAQRSLNVSAPGFMANGAGADLTPAGRTFVTDFKATYHRSPQLGAIFGYEAMAVVLDALRRAGSNASNRSTVVTTFMGSKRPAGAGPQGSVLGTYSINGNGDISLAPYIFSHITAGKLVPFEALQG
jgi:branched-chain amino acid transport system substrate-binding protein